MGIAKRLQKALGVDIARIETVKPYTGSYDVIAVGTPNMEQGFEGVLCA